MTQTLDLNSYCEMLRSHFDGRFSARRVIYTVMIGSYDKLKTPKYQEPSFKYYCITDNATLDFGIWEPILLPSLYRSTQRTSRVVKVRPELIFGQLEQSVYIDASIQIRRPLGTFLREYCTTHDLTVFQHGQRQCIYEEAQECIRQAKDDPATMTMQMQRYREQDYPEQHGLISGGLIVRTQSEPLRVLMIAWLEEIDKGSQRDQLSFNFSAWKTGISFSTIAMDIFRNDFFLILPHQPSAQAGRVMNSKLGPALHHCYLSVRVRLGWEVRRRTARWTRIRRRS